MFLKNILLKDYTTYKIGGKAKYFFVARNEQDLIDAIKKARQDNLSFFILGGGSNVLFDDNGFDGLVIKLELDKYEVKDNKIFTESGILLKRAVDLALGNELTGLEWANGIYGTVGGAVRGNAGAFGHFTSEVVDSVKVLDSDTLEIKEIKDYQFGYRDSYFKQNRNLIILSVVFKLEKGRKEDIEKEMNRISNYRKERHPLDYPSAGSVFKNVANLKIDKFKELGFVPAGYLIEQAGLKGKIIGGAQISEKHANFIVNINEAKAKDIRDLIDLVKKTIMEKYGVKMEEEIVVL